MNISEMNVIILLAGKGSRTSDYSDLPKPMININGSAILKRTTDSLPFFKDLSRKKLWFAVLEEHVNKFKIDSWLKSLYGNDINIISFPAITRGNLETAKIVYDKMGLESGTFPLLILDSDNEYDGSKVLDSFIEHEEEKNHIIIYYFEPDGNSHWCFAMQRDNIVYDLQEKNPHAEFVGGLPMIGVFYFNKGSLFGDSAHYILNKWNPDSKEFYMSQSVRERLGQIPVFGCKVGSVIPLGTTDDLQRVHPKKRLRICLDLDDTINFCKKQNEEYGHESLQPDILNILNRWKEEGHYIIIQTARHMNTCEGNVGKVVAKQGLTTLQWLKNNNVPFDEIYFSKPHADVFIDDKAIRHTPGDWKTTLEKFHEIERSIKK